MRLRHKLTIFLSVFCGVFLLGSLLFVSPQNNKVNATDVGDETYKTFLLSTNGYSPDDMSLSFDNFVSSSYQMKVIQTNTNSKLFYASVPNSNISGTNVYFRNSSRSIVANTTRRNDTNAYYLNGTNTVSACTTSIGTACDYLESSYQTRRLWFTLSSSVSGFPGVYVEATGKRYMLTEISSGEDSRTYYYVDIPSNVTAFAFNYVNDEIGKNNSVISKATYTNVVMHQINYVNITDKNMSKYNDAILDQYVINEYLRGFSSCLASDTNGYGAFPYISNIMGYYHLSESLLDEVYQNDYLPSDYDNGYIATTIKDGYVISALTKYQELQSNYSLHNNRVVLSSIDGNNSNTLIIVLFGILSFASVGGYLFLSRR